MRIPPGNSEVSLHSRRASVLLEVVLALALFVAAATVISAGLRASVQAVGRLRETARAEDLAISALSELQLGLRPLESGSAQPFPAPFDEWTCEIAASSTSESSTAAPSIATVEVIIRHPSTETVRRLAQVIRVPNTIAQPNAAPAELPPSDPEAPSL
jgi:type II secretory pathway pseudopilin PulG